MSQPTLPEMTPPMVRLLLGKDDAQILEIGANDGTDTVGFLRMFTQGRVSCFECDPRAIKGWKKNLAGQGRASLHEMALGATDQVMEFWPSGGKPPGPQWKGVQSWDKSGSLLKPDRHVDYARWIRFGPPIRVPVRPLDAVADKRIWDFAWVDVQGAEALVLKGAQETIKRIRWWYCECHSKPFYHNQATVPELSSLLPGFVLHSVHQADNFLFRNTQVQE